DSKPKPASQQPAPLPFSDVLAGGSLNEIKRKLQQTHLPGVVHTLDDRGHRLVRRIEHLAEPPDHIFLRRMHDLLADVRLPKLEPIAEKLQIAAMLLEKIGKFARSLPEALQHQLREMLRSHDRRPLRMNPPVADAHAIH